MNIYFTSLFLYIYFTSQTWVWSMYKVGGRYHSNFLKKSDDLDIFTESKNNLIQSCCSNSSQRGLVTEHFVQVPIRKFNV